ncbi:lipoprotein [Spiroplasma phoeniceum]|uniref:Spiroplasma plectrovirus-related protein n=1 Tax=Spiroplasma phoeniceum P40 TaxID=1276259 RepID=A0A345DR66_9MOLU|nr:lipoprotein [Spiroplasma phoeniceum]AXF96707.1 spiroplasma plectrovirus-related protein [Spiroplasma phoeniceum P40]
MKKWLSIIGAIGLTATSTTTLISCKKENNNKNEEDNKPKPSYNPQQPNPQQPPKDSNWKLMNKIIDFWNLTPNNKWYILLLNNYVSNNWNIMKIHLTINPRDIIFEPNNLLKSVYLWDGDGKPETPTIDKNTGEITDWKEQKGTK